MVFLDSFCYWFYGSKPRAGQQLEMPQRTQSSHCGHTLIGSRFDLSLLPDFEMLDFNRMTLTNQFLVLILYFVILLT